jgi:hypothetical protein
MVLRSALEELRSASLHHHDPVAHRQLQLALLTHRQQELERRLSRLPADDPSVEALTEQLIGVIELLLQLHVD